MEDRSTFFSKGNIIPLTLLASAIVGAIAAMSVLLFPMTQSPLAEMKLSPTEKTLQIGETFTVDVMVQASVPVNVFAGELHFDNHVLEVESIDYNTSIADLWAKKPWYSNGEGTLNFIGGTTQKGGFLGTDRLIRITFKTLAQGAGALTISDAQVLQDDGLGTLAPLAQPIDALFTVQQNGDLVSKSNNLLHEVTPVSSYTIVPKAPSADLNNDGSVNITDASILLLHMNSTDMRYDLNMDGTVNLNDMQVILKNR